MTTYLIASSGWSLVGFLAGTVFGQWLCKRKERKSVDHGA